MKHVLMKLNPENYKMFFLSLGLGMCGFVHAQAWTQKTSFTSGREEAIAFTVDKRIYFGGGVVFTGGTQNYTDLWEYDPANDTWIQRSNLPGTVPGFRNGIAFSINGKGYAGLGIDILGNFKNELWEYDPSSDLWTQKSSLPSAGREGAACFVVDDKAYVVGGADASRYAQVWEYDPALDTWTQKGNYPAGPIISATAFSINHKGYVTCGYPGNDVSKVTYEYNPAANSWSPKAAFAGAARQELVAFAVNDRAYCGLGRGFTFSSSYKDFYSYDPYTNTWSSEGDFPGLKRFGAFAVSCNNKGYVGGGTNFSDSEFNDLYEFTGPDVTGLLSRNLSENSLSCYPVPATGEIHIKGSKDNEGIFYKLYTTSGMLLMENQLDKSGVIDAKVLPEGTYTLLLQKQANISSHTILIKK